MPQMHMRQTRKQVTSSHHTDTILSRRKAAPGKQCLPLAATLVEGAAIVPLIEECVPASDEKYGPPKEAPQCAIECSVDGVRGARFRSSCRGGGRSRRTSAHLWFDLRENRQLGDVV